MIERRSIMTLPASEPSFTILMMSVVLGAVG
jgi:hypothetical protein